MRCVICRLTAEPRCRAVVAVTPNSTSDIDTSLHGNRNPTDKLSTFPNLFLYQYFDSPFCLVPCLEFLHQHQQRKSKMSVITHNSRQFHVQETTTIVPASKNKSIYLLNFRLIKRVTRLTSPSNLFTLINK